MGLQHVQVPELGRRLVCPPKAPGLLLGPGRPGPPAELANLGGGMKEADVETRGRLREVVPEQR